MIAKPHSWAKYATNELENWVEKILPKWYVKKKKKVRKKKKEIEGRREGERKGASFWEGR